MDATATAQPTISHTERLGDHVPNVAPVPDDATNRQSPDRRFWWKCTALSEFHPFEHYPRRRHDADAQEPPERGRDVRTTPSSCPEFKSSSCLNNAPANSLLPANIFRIVRCWLVETIPAAINAGFIPHPSAPLEQIYAGVTSNVMDDTGSFARRTRRWSAHDRAREKIRRRPRYLNGAARPPAVAPNPARATEFNPRRRDWFST